MTYLPPEIPITLARLCELTGVAEGTLRDAVRRNLLIITRQRPTLVRLCDYYVWANAQEEGASTGRGRDAGTTSERTVSVRNQAQDRDGEGTGQTNQRRGAGSTGRKAPKPKRRKRGEAPDVVWDYGKIVD